MLKVKQCCCRDVSTGNERTYAQVLVALALRYPTPSSLEQRRSCTPGAPPGKFADMSIVLRVAVMGGEECEGTYPATD